MCIAKHTAKSAINEMEYATRVGPLKEKDHDRLVKTGKDFTSLVSEVKALKRQYDCVIPVSGGKIAPGKLSKRWRTWLNPLCVTWRTPARSDLGERNLRNLVSIGVNHIDFSINPKVGVFYF